MYSQRYWNEPPETFFTEHLEVAASPQPNGVLKVMESPAPGPHAITTLPMRKEIQCAIRFDVDLMVIGSRDVAICMDSDNGNAAQLFDPSRRKILGARESSIHAVDAAIEAVDVDQARLRVLFVGSNLSEHFSARLCLVAKGTDDETYTGDPAAGLSVSRINIRALGL